MDPMVTAADGGTYRDGMNSSSNAVVDMVSGDGDDTDC